ncbi:UDP-2,3-diacylglucosamine diphosphatase [Gammaproteobacteria bacterium]|nr:UDP-2,3-diacylglucosamine diphosphatase [Gammaproteobacteria bacterium]
MSQHCFIADLHLSAHQPQIASEYLRFLQTLPEQVEQLHILGDLFDYWIGDDALDMLGAAPIFDALGALVKRGVSVDFMHGNRDFLIGDALLANYGITRLREPVLIEPHGQRILIAHGDRWCTRDLAYQRFRHEQIENRDWQAAFLQLPIPQRIEMAKQAREASNQSIASNDDAVMDVVLGEITAEAQAHQATIVIHGHTHKPALIARDDYIHCVVGDWRPQPSYALVGGDEIRLVTAQSADTLPLSCRSA